MKAKMIAGHELTPGKTVKDHIHVEGTELHVPHVLLCGEQPGPTVLITAGIHNAEYVGIQAAIELSNELDVSTLRGNVVLVPLVNRSGFENRTMSRVLRTEKISTACSPATGRGARPSGWRICSSRSLSATQMLTSTCTAATVMRR